MTHIGNSGLEVGNFSSSITLDFGKDASDNTYIANGNFQSIAVNNASSVAATSAMPNTNVLQRISWSMDPGVPGDSFHIFVNGVDTLTVFRTSPTQIHGFASIELPVNAGDGISVQYVPDPLGVNIGGTVILETSFSSEIAPIPTPLEILGAGNLAVWLQGDLGTAPGPINPWPNQVPNGDAVQDTNVTVPVLVANSFGSKPGVSASLNNAGLTVTFISALNIGDRPFIFMRAKLDAVDLVNGTSLVGIGDDPVFNNFIGITAYATGIIGPQARWDLNVVPEQETQVLLTGQIDTNPHTFVGAWQQSPAFIVDNDTENAPGVVNAPTFSMNKMVLFNEAPFGAPDGSAGGNIGVFILVRNTPTAAQMSALINYCNAYQ